MSSAGRITSVGNPAKASSKWVCRDISQWTRGIFDMYISRDLDRHGTMGRISPSGNSGDYDGVFWLEQVDPKAPVPSFTPARAIESPALPLPPVNSPPVRQPTLHPRRPRRDLDGTLSPKLRT